MFMRLADVAVRYRDWIAGACLAGTSLLFHALIFMFWGPHPFGYDAGFYRRYLIEPIVSFPNTPVPGLGDDALVPRIVFDVLRLTHLPPDTILYGSYLAMFMLLPVLLFFLLKRHLGFRGAVLAGLLAIFSPIQYNAYWYMLWKNAWALCLLILAFILWDRRLILPLLALDVALALSHKTTAVIYLATLVILLFLNRERWRETLAHIALTSACLALVSFAMLQKALAVSPQAIFIGWPTYMSFSIPLLIVIACGWRVCTATRMPPPVIALLVASFVLPALHVPFFERIFIFSDIALMILAAYAIEYLLGRISLSKILPREYSSALFAGALCVSGGLFAGILWDQVRALGPIASPESIAQIEAIGTQVPHDATILTTSNEAPLYEGWTVAHIAAPGMLHDSHDLDAWMVFWSATSSAEKIAFLNDFHPPLYMSTLEPMSNLLGSTTIPCLARISPALFLDACGTGK